MKKYLLLLLIFFTNQAIAQIDATLLSAIQQTNLKKVELLIKNGADLSATDEYGASVLVHAIQSAELPMVKLILRHDGVIPKEGVYYDYETYFNTLIPSWYGDLLAVAVGEGNLALLKYLVEEKGMSVETITPHKTKPKFSNWTLLMHAAQNEHGAIIQYLIQKGIKINQQNEVGKTASQLTDDTAVQQILAQKDTTLLNTYIIYQQLQDNLFSIYTKEMSYEAFEIIADSLIAKAKKLYGIKHPRYGSTLKDVALFYRYYGKYTIAHQYLLEGLKILAKSLGNQHPEYILSSTSLASVYNLMGDYSSAIPIYEKAVNYIRKTYGENHLEFILFSQHLATAYYQNKSFETAISIYQELLAITQKTRFDDLEVAYLYEGIAKVYRAAGDYKAALANIQEGIKIIETKYEKNTEVYRNFSQILGEIHIEMGAYDKALPMLMKNLSFYKKQLGANHFAFANYLHHLGGLNQKTGNKKAANRIYSDLINNLNYNINHQFLHLPTSVQLVWKEQLETYKNQINSFFLHQGLPKRAYEFNSQFKGMTIRNLKLLQKDEETYQEWVALNEQIARELSKPKNEQVRELENWNRIALELESKLLADDLFNKNKKVDVDSLKSHLNPDEVVLDFVRFNYFNPNKTDSIYYVAYIVDPNKDNIEQVFLFEEGKLDKIINKNKARKADFIAYLYNIDSRGVVVEGANLFDLIWKPLMPYLTNKKTIHFSPAGLLNDINHNAILINKDSTLIDKFNLKRYTNIRSIQAPERIYTNNNYILVGGVDYDANWAISNDSSDLSSQTNRLSANLVDSISTPNKVAQRARNLPIWRYLKWTQKEIDMIDATFKKTDKWKGHILKGDMVREENIKRRRGVKNEDMRVAHFASHGFFFPDPQKEENIDLPYFCYFRGSDASFWFNFVGCQSCLVGKTT